MSETPLSRPAFYQYFRDRHDLMETLLGVVKERIRAEANPWLTGEDEPEALRESLRGVVAVGVELGAVLRAVSEAAPFDQRLQRSWRRFLSYWDDAVTTRIGAQQATGKIDCFDAGAIAKALNALDVAVLVQAFGRKPHADPEAVLDTLHRIWVGAIYARLGPACQS